MAPSQGSLALHRYIEGKSFKIVQSEIRRSRPLIFGKLASYSDLYQVYSNYNWVQKWPLPRGHLVYIVSFKEKSFKNLV